MSTPMAEAALKPVFTQAEVEEFGELLDIARFLLKRVALNGLNDQWHADRAVFEVRRAAFIELIRDRLIAYPAQGGG